MSEFSSGVLVRTAHEQQLREYVESIKLEENVGFVRRVNDLWVGLFVFGNIKVKKLAT